MLFLNTVFRSGFEKIAECLLTLGKDFAECSKKDTRQSRLRRHYLCRVFLTLGKALRSGSECTTSPSSSDARREYMSAMYVAAGMAAMHGRRSVPHIYTWVAAGQPAGRLVSLAWDAGRRRARP